MRDVEKRNDIYKKAKAFAEASEEKLADGFKYVIENVEVAKKEVEKMANMKDSELEEYLKTNSKSVLDKIIGAVKKYSGKMKANADLFPSFLKDAEKADNIVEFIKEVLDEEELSGWGKYPEIVETLRIWLLKIFYASYKKPSLLGTLAEVLSLPYVIAGAMAFDAVSNHIEKKKQKATAVEEIKIEPVKKRIYRNHCWNCHSPVTEEDERCSECGWYICSCCGKCKKGCSAQSHQYHSSFEDDLPFYSATDLKHDCLDDEPDLEPDEYNTMLEECGNDEDFLESTPEYWEYLYNEK